MRAGSTLLGTLSAFLAGTASAAQAPVSDVDAHVATARAAAGQEYRATFVNLCLPRGGGRGARRGAGSAAGRGAQGAPAAGRAGSSGGGSRGRRRTGNAGPSGLVRLALQGLRQSLLARHATAFVLGAAHERRHHHHRHQLRLGDAAGDHRRPDDAGAQSARHQVRDHQPRSRRSRSRRGGAPEPLRREGGDGRRRLGLNAAAAPHRCRRRAEARHRSRTGGHHSLSATRP